MIKQGVILLMFVTLSSKEQDVSALDKIRSEFQQIGSEEDIYKILEFEYEPVDKYEDQMIRAYKATATCMLANYVFSPVSKLKYFNEGKKSLEEMIRIGKDVENVYLRMLLQLNVPRSLNYHKNIEEDVNYLQDSLADAPIDISYKQRMISTLVSVAKKKDLKEVLLQINVL